MRLDDFVTVPPRCIFCRTTTGPFDKEDVFPKWFRKAMPGGTIFEQRNWKDTLNLRPDNVIRLKLEGAICKSCNNDWMATLEKRVKKLIARSIVAEKKLELKTQQQDDLARWAVQKALLIELAASQLMPQRDLAYVTDEHLWWLYSHRVTGELPPGSRVWLFVNNVVQKKTAKGHRSRIFSHLPVQLVPSGIESASELDICGMLSTFTIAFLGFQVFVADFIHESPKRPSPSIPPSLRPFTRRIGDGVLPIARWPKSDRVIDGEEAFIDLAIWDGNLFAGWDGFRGFVGERPEPPTPL